MARRPVLHHRRPAALAGGLLAIALCGLLVGCTSNGGRLETGYRYRPIGATTFERRAFYTDRFSVEARQADAYRTAEEAVGRPRVGGR